MRRGLILALIVGGTACATERAGTTWSDDHLEGIGSSAREPGTPRGEAAGRMEVVTIGPASSEAGRPSQELELAIIRFTSKRRRLMAEDASGGGRGRWPRPLEVAWADILGELESGLGSSPGSVPRRVLIQARVTMEVELETTRARYGTAPQAFVDRIGRLFARIAVHMRARPPDEDDRPRFVSDLSLIWPVSPIIVTSPFGYRRDPILGRENIRFHSGIDLGGASGDIVHAAGGGRVLSAGWLGGSGRAVVIQHAGGYETIYAHLRKILVEQGVEVDAGTPIGFVGSSGRSTGPHLHFEVRRGGLPIDPLEVVDARSGADEFRGRAHARAGGAASTAGADGAASDASSASFHENSSSASFHEDSSSASSGANAHAAR